MLGSGFGCNEQTWIQMKKDGLAEQSVLTLLYGLRFEVFGSSGFPL